MDLSSTEEVCTHSDTESHEDSEQLFLSNNYDDILDLYDELKEMFPMNPNFLILLESVTFCDFITDLIFERINKYDHITNDFFTFIEVFNHEIRISYNYINNFMFKYNTKISIQQWEKFCFTYSELYDSELM